MTKFYANENLAIDLVEALRCLGHDVLTSVEAGQANQGISDQAVLAYATLNGRSVITFNRDDFIALHRSGIGHGGIVVCKDDRDYLGQAQVLHQHLITQMTEIENRLLRVLRQNQPKSSEQFFIVKEDRR